MNKKKVLCVCAKGINRSRLLRDFKKKFKSKKRIIIIDVTDSKRLLPKEFSHLRDLPYDNFQKKWTRPQLLRAVKKLLPL